MIPRSGRSAGEGIGYPLSILGLPKRLPSMRETQVRSLGWEVPLEKEMVTYSSILAWRIPWTKKPGGLQPMGSQRVRHNLMTEQSPARGLAASYGASGVRSLFNQKL